MYFNKNIPELDVTKFIGGEWLSGILLVFLVDSWLAPILFNAAMDLYSELK